MMSMQLNLKDSETWHTSKKHFLIIVASIFINLLGLAFPLFILQIYDRIIPNAALKSLFILVLLVIIAVIFEVLLKVLRAMITVWNNIRAEYLYQRKLVAALLDSDIKVYEKYGPGDYLERLRNITSLRENLSGQNFINYIDAPFVLIFFLLVTYLGGWLVLIPIILLASLIYAYYILSKGFDYEKEAQQKNHDRRSNYLIELLNGIHTIKSLAFEKLLLRRYERLQAQTTEINYNLKRHTTYYQTTFNFISQLNTILIVALGAVLVIQGKMTVGGLAACTLLATRMLQPINQILLQRQYARTQVAEKKKILQVEDIPKVKFNAKNKKHVITEGKIQFKQVSFNYKNQPVLMDTNLTIPGKQTVAITGGNASGKSTLLQLITGVITANSGKILIDDHDIKDYNFSYLQKTIAYLAKDQYLFAGTILDNLTMFQKNLRQQAYHLCQELGLEPLLVKLPQGYYTEVGTASVELLSPGIRQMITIIRGLVANELKIILFDEANMGLDLSLDLNLIKFLKNLQHQCTIVLVSYRPSILELASKHYYLHNGWIDENNNVE